MAIIETFSLKDHELKAIKERAEAGNQFYGNLLAGYEQHGSLTKKQYDAYKSAVKLTSAEVAFLKRRADAEGIDGGSRFLTEMHEQYERDGYLTKKQHEQIKKNMDEEKNRPRVAGKPVGNRMMRDGKVVCRGEGPEGKCKEFATKVVGDFGYCAPHADEFAQAEEK